MKTGKRWVLLLFVVLSVLWAGSISAVAATPLESHGALSVQGAKIVDSHGKAFQLKGVSTHGLSWFPEYVSKEAFQSLRDQWGANTVRLAMYTAEYNGYCTGSTTNRITLKNLVDKGVKAATELGMYVIIDWHILQDNNPNTYKSQSIAFFREMAAKYKNYNNVIYEICNEPNGGTGWSQVKSYARSVIGEIRKTDKDAIIIVGTPTWSQDVDQAAKSPVAGYSNIAYSFHFYANTHRESYRTKLENALKKGLPVVVTEFGICDASGNGSVNRTEGDRWISLLNRYQTGYVCWNLSNKNESSALLKSSCKKKSGWSSADLSDSGKWLVDTLKGKLPSGTQSSESVTKPSSSSTQTAGTVSGGKSVKASKKYCSISLKREKTWKSGKRYYSLYRLVINNKSSKYSISDWKVQIRFKKSIKKSNSWNGKMKFSSKTVTISPVSWNRTIARKGKAKDIGFIVSSSSKSNKVSSAVFK